MEDIWRPPSHPLWPRFANCVDLALLEWDVLNAIVDGGYGWGNPRENKDKLIDDLLANFADKWTAGQDVEVTEVNNFFVGSLDDLFNADVDFGTVSVVSRLLVTLYNECRQGIETGLSAIESRHSKATQSVEQAIATMEGTSLSPSDATSQTKAGQGAGSSIADNGETPASVEPTAEVLNTQVAEDPDAPADDGWAVVTKKKGKRRGAGALPQVQ